MHFAVLVVAMFSAVVAPRDPSARVHDFANLLSASDRASLEALSRDIDRETTAEIVVVTVPSLDGLTVDDYAHRLFNSWGLGKREAKNGVLLLVAPNERRMRFEIGYGLETLLTDSLCGEIRDQQVVPRFRANDFPGGILAGTRRIAGVLRDHPKAARGDPNSGPLLARTREAESMVATGAVGVTALVLFALGVLSAIRRLYSSVTFFFVTAASVALVATAAFLVFRGPVKGPVTLWFGAASVLSLAAWGLNYLRYSRFGPHGCSKCGTRLELLSEQEDDPKLTSVQLLEEQIGSVDYDVWICPACLNQDTEQYIKNFSGYQSCPACEARTFKEDSPVTIVAATTLGSGRARIEGRCVACNHKSSRFIVLAQLADNSSSSSGSGVSSGGSFGGGGGGGGGFGGGSSGGGGASGGW